MLGGALTQTAHKKIDPVDNYKNRTINIIHKAQNPCPLHLRSITVQDGIIGVSYHVVILYLHCILLFRNGGLNKINKFRFLLLVTTVAFASALSRIPGGRYFVPRFGSPTSRRVFSVVDCSPR